MTARQTAVPRRQLDDGWRELAACRDQPGEIFFEDGRGPSHYVAARAVCRSCPVRAQCLEYALAVEAIVGYRFGCWAGLSPAQRSRLARRRQLGIGPQSTTSEE